MRALRATAGVALVGAVFAACGPATVSRTSGNPFDPRGSGALVIEVRNQGLEQVTLYAVSAARRLRMGVVPAKSGARFTVLWPSPDRISVAVQRVGGDRFVTPATHALPGEVVELTVSSNLRDSRIRH